MNTSLSRITAVVNNPVARNSAIMFFGTMVTNFGAYLYHLVVGRVLGPEQYSEFAALFSLLFLLSVPAAVLQLVLTKYFSVYRASQDIGQAKTLFVKSLTSIIAISILGGCVYLLIIPTLQNLLHIQHYDSFLYLYFIVIGTFIVTCCTGLLNGYQKFFSSSSISTILMFVRLLTGIILAPFGVALTLFGNVIANIVSFIFFFFSVRFVLRAIPKKIEIKKKDMILFAVPTLLSTLGITIFFNMDVVLVKHFFSPTEAGIYASLTIFGKIIFFAASPIIMVVFPMLVEKKEQKKNYYSLFLVGLLLVVGISLSLVVIYFLSAQFVTQILFGDRFISAAPLLGRFGLFIAFVTIANYLMTACLAIGKVRAGIMVLIGAICECLAIVLFHSDLSELITSVTVVSAVLSGVLLIYYVHEPSTKSGLR